MSSGTSIKHSLDDSTTDSIYGNYSPNKVYEFNIGDVQTFEVCIPYTLQLFWSNLEPHKYSKYDLRPFCLKFIAYLLSNHNIFTLH